MLRRVERRQLILGGAGLGVGQVPLVGAAAVGPEDPRAEVDDVRRPVRRPRLAAELPPLLGLRLERLLVRLLLAVGHLVRLAPGDHEAALDELRLDVGPDPAGLLHDAPEVDQVGLPDAGHAGHLGDTRSRTLRSKQGACMTNRKIADRNHPPRPVFSYGSQEENA